MWEVFKKLCEIKGVSIYRVSKETKISTATFTGWKQGKWKPKYETLKTLADYFGVSVEYIMTGKEKEPQPDNQEAAKSSELDIKLRSMLNAMTEEEKTLLLDLVLSLRGNGK